jgi:hypothetical protein
MKEKVTIELCTSDNSVKIDGKSLKLGKSLSMVDHSPTGFAWGYGGSGPAQLALAILLEVAGKDLALRHYQRFKWDYVSQWPFGVDGTYEVPIKAWIEDGKGEGK